MEQQTTITFSFCRNYLFSYLYLKKNARALSVWYLRATSTWITYAVLNRSWLSFKHWRSSFLIYVAAMFKHRPLYKMRCLTIKKAIKTFKINHIATERGEKLTWEQNQTKDKNHKRWKRNNPILIRWEMREEVFKNNYYDC